MAKDKKKKKKDKRSAAAATVSIGGKAAERLKSISQNPLAADVIAAALVATAAALKDANKARKLAAQAGDQLTDLAKEGVDRGNAMWQLALDVGRQALEELTGKDGPKAPRKAAAKSARKIAAKPAGKTAVKGAPKATRKGAPKAATRSAPRVARKGSVRRSTRPGK